MVLLWLEIVVLNGRRLIRCFGLSWFNATVFAKFFVLFGELGLSNRLAFGRGNLACFHQGFETRQILGDLDVWFFAKKLREESCEFSARWIILERDFHDRRAVELRFKADTASVRNVSAFARSPRDESVRLFVKNDRVPFHRAAARGFDGPTRFD